MKTAINLGEKFGKFSEHWSPKIIAQMNDYDIGTIVSLLRVRIHPQDVVVLLTTLRLEFNPHDRAKCPLDILSHPGKIQ